MFLLARVRSLIRAHHADAEWQLRDAPDIAFGLAEGAVDFSGQPKCMVIGTDMPASVELVITETEPGIQGDRVSGATKPATLETGLTIQVPLFVGPGERVKVDTRSGSYISRA